MTMIDSNREDFITQLQSIAENAIFHCGVVLTGDPLEFIIELSDVTINAMDWGSFSYDEEKDIYERFVDDFIAGIFYHPRTKDLALSMIGLNWENPSACREKDVRSFIASYPSVFQATLAALANKIALAIVNEIDDFVTETYEVHPSFEAFGFIPEDSGLYDLATAYPRK